MDMATGKEGMAVRRELRVRREATAREVLGMRGTGDHSSMDVVLNICRGSIRRIGSGWIHRRRRRRRRRTSLG